MPVSTPRFAAPLVALLLVVVAGCGDDSDGGAAANPPDRATTAPSVNLISVEIVGGQPVGGARQERAALGEPVTLRVTADAPDQVHVHGYDLLAAVAPGQPAEIAFVADTSGQFEVELEQAHVRIIDLIVLGP